MLTILLICIINHCRKELNVLEDNKMKNKTKENTLSLDATMFGQTRNLMIGFFMATALITMGGTAIETVDDIKTAKEFNKGLYGNSKLTKTDKRDLVNNSVLFIAAFAIVCVTYNALRSSKRYNDAAAIRIARRYMLQMCKTNPELKKYDYILNNQMALHNIAAGIANILPMSETLDMGCYWEVLQRRLENTKSKTDELREENIAIQSVIKDLRGIADKDPKFIDKLKVLVDNSAKTFALDMYMTNQKTR